MTAVRRRTATQDVAAAARVTVLLAVSVAFVAGGARGLPAFGGVLFLIVGASGIALFGGRLVLSVGRVAGRRPVLELDEREVRLPAAWPRSRADDRRLAWPEVASVVLWSQAALRGRRLRSVEQLTFLPTAERAEGSPPPPSAELLAMGLDDVPGVATLHWSIEVSPGWDTDLATIFAEIHRRGVPTADVRSR
ncbi:hypothetical protein NE236_31600 [Actinoallomurus purpureus]|uniref:hypothetical protein n=1 Tax=Actinoallomurus purpureus TaxID=478114 RepID=UPI002092238D|nr:hypothetical protein [Actinoallomurus purpureus]MCO6009526.1 hypothetical protein [Actinoallomurus purpureus]